MHKKIVKHIGKLKQKKYRREYGEFLVEGIKGVSEALLSNFETALLVVDGKRRDEKGIAHIINKAEKKGIAVEFGGRKDIDLIKSTDTFPGVLAIVEIPERDSPGLLNKKPIIILDGINDPGNLGTIIRTADWFGIPNIVISRGSVDPYNEKVVRSTMGSLFHVNIVDCGNLARRVKGYREKGYTAVGLDTKGKPISKAKLGAKNVYIFGSESHGISEGLDALLDHRYTIEGSGSAESLNVAVAAGIVMSYI